MNSPSVPASAAIPAAGLIEGGARLQVLRGRRRVLCLYPPFVDRNAHANPLLFLSLTTSIRTPMYASTLTNPTPYTLCTYVLGHPVQHDGL